MELNALQQPASLVSWDCLVEYAGRMGRQIVEHYANAIGLGIVHVGEFAHALGHVGGGSMPGDLHLAPGTIHVDYHEQIGRAVAPVQLLNLRTEIAIVLERFVDVALCIMTIFKMRELHRGEHPEPARSEVDPQVR